MPALQLQCHVIAAAVTHTPAMAPALPAPLGHASVCVRVCVRVRVRVCVRVRVFARVRVRVRVTVSMGALRSLPVCAHVSACIRVDV